VGGDEGEFIGGLLQGVGFDCTVLDTDKRVDELKGWTRSCVQEQAVCVQSTLVGVWYDHTSVSAVDSRYLLYRSNSFILVHSRVVRNRLKPLTIVQKSLRVVQTRSSKFSVVQINSSSMKSRLLNGASSFIF
jgi:hypothetical protein